MAEEWLKHLVHEVKEKDRAPAEATARFNHEQKIIESDGPVLWRSFADFLGKYVEEMRVDFSDDITLREGKLSFSQQSTQISIGKAAFPCVAFAATPNYQQRIAQIFYSSVNPRPPHPQGAPSINMPCRFEVRQQDKVFLQLDGKPFHEAHEAAKYIIEKLFTIHPA
jgi:hypothetical protein